MKRLIFAVALLAAAPAFAATPGVGFRVRNGTPTHFEDTGSGANRGGATFNDAFVAILPSGADAPNYHEQAAGRWYGGDLAKKLAMGRGSGMWGENEGINATALKNAYAAMKRGELVELPGGAFWQAGDWSGDPTRSEALDLAYIIPRSHPFYRTWAHGQMVDIPGATPENPRQISASRCAPSANLPRYFVDLNLVWGTAEYYDQGVCKPGEISYSERRRDARGRTVPAYPHVFGEPLPPIPPVEPPAPPPADPPTQCAPACAPMPALPAIPPDLFSLLADVKKWRGVGRVKEARIDRAEAQLRSVEEQLGVLGEWRTGVESTGRCEVGVRP